MRPATCAVSYLSAVPVGRIADYSVHIINEVTPGKGVVYSVAFHAVILGKIIVISDVFDNRRLTEYIGFLYDIVKATSYPF